MHTHKLIISILVAITLSTGCALRGSGSSVAFAVDGALMVGGLMTVASNQGKDCRSPPSNTGNGLDDAANDWGNGIGDGFCEAGKSMGTALGAALLLAGGLGAIMNVMVNSDGGDSDKSEKPVPGAGTDLSGYTANSPDDPCAEVVDTWRAETDQATREKLFRGLSATCQQRITELRKESSKGAPASSSTAMRPHIGGTMDALAAARHMPR